MQKIEVRFVHRDLAAQRHHPARSQQRQVEALAVVRRAGAERLQFDLQRFDERALVTDVVQQVLSQDELSVAEVRDAEQKNIRARAASETRRLGVQPKDVLPAGRRITLEAEVRDQTRIARSPADDLESKIVECDALLEHFERSVDSRGAGTETLSTRETPPLRVGDPSRAGALGASAARVHLPMAAYSVAFDDRGDSRSKIVHARDKRCATDARTSAPSAYAGPTQDGQPDPQPHDSRCSRARSMSASYDLKRRSEKPMPPGVMSYR